MAIKNKKAGERFLIFWWIILVVLIALGISIGTSLFYSRQLEVRGIEADILTNNLLNCIIKNGQLNAKFLDEKINVFDECKLNENILEKKGLFFFEISIYEDSELKNTVSKGDAYFKTLCALRGEAKAEHFPVCSVKKAYVFENKQFLIEVKTASNQIGGQEKE